MYCIYMNSLLDNSLLEFHELKANQANPKKSIKSIEKDSKKEYSNAFPELLSMKRMESNRENFPEIKLIFRGGEKTKLIFDKNLIIEEDQNIGDKMLDLMRDNPNGLNIPLDYPNPSAYDCFTVFFKIATNDWIGSLVEEDKITLYPIFKFLDLKKPMSICYDAILNNKNSDLTFLVTKAVIVSYFNPLTEDIKQVLCQAYETCKKQSLDSFYDILAEAIDPNSEYYKEGLVQEIILSIMEFPTKNTAEKHEILKRITH